MEDFDRYIKSEIDSLHEVPGVEFDEKRAWERIESNPKRGLFFGLGIVLILVSLMIIFLPGNEGKEKTTENSEVQKSVPLVLVDSNNVQTPNAIPLEKVIVKNTDSVRAFKRESSKELKKKKKKNQSALIYPVRTLVKRQRTLSPKLVNREVKEREKEISLSLQKDSYTASITHLKKVNNHLSLTYGLQFNRRFNQRRRTSEGMSIPFEINQIQAALGVRYNFSRRERRFQPHLYTGFTNSFLLLPDAKTMDYNLKYEADFGLDYRIFSTKEGKEVYLRFRLPLYNKNIINPSVYKPSLYDVLKQ